MKKIVLILAALTTLSVSQNRIVVKGQPSVNVPFILKQIGAKNYVQSRINWWVIQCDNEKSTNLIYSRLKTFHRHSLRVIEKEGLIQPTQTKMEE